MALVDKANLLIRGVQYNMDNYGYKMGPNIHIKKKVKTKYWMQYAPNMYK